MSQNSVRDGFNKLLDGLPEGDIEALLHILHERHHALKSNGTRHDQGTIEHLLCAASCYALHPRRRPVNDRSNMPDAWPFDIGRWKPNPDDRFYEAIRAAQLVLAAISAMIRIRDRDGSPVVREMPVAVLKPDGTLKGQGELVEE